MIASIILNSIALCVFIVLYLIIQYQNKINKKYLNDYEDRLESYRIELLKYHSKINDFHIDIYLYELALDEFFKLVKRKRKNKNLIKTYKDYINTYRNSISEKLAEKQKDIVNQKRDKLG